MASKELIEALETVYQLAEDNVLDFDDDDQFLKDEIAKQRGALKRVNRFITNLRTHIDKNGDKAGE